MRWTRGGRSINLEDRRGLGFPTGGGRIGGGMKMGLGGTLLLLILSLLFGRNLISTDTTPAPVPRGGSANAPAGEESMVEFVSFVLDDSQAVWKRQFAAMGRDYQDAKLVLFTEGVQSDCGSASAAVGPFYCPVDGKVYIDLSFYQELRDRFGAPGDFAQAYVIAHELGHHVQNLLGIHEQVRRAQAQNPSMKNELSVRMELQADCLAGVWGHSTHERSILERGDVEEGLGAAAAIGDDRLSGGRASSESFTHGSSAQRVRWFKRGLEAGSVEACDTFNTQQL